MQGYVFLSLLAAFFYSLAGISGKIATKHKIENIYKLLFWLNASALLFVPFLWLKADAIQNPLIAIKPLLIFLATFCAAAYMMWKLMYRMDISVVQIGYLHIDVLYAPKINKKRWYIFTCIDRVSKIAFI